MSKVYNMTRYRIPFLILSLSLIVIFWVGTFLQGGFNFGIDFRAGLNISADLGEPTDIADVRSAVESLNNVQVQSMGADDSIYSIRLPEDESNPDFRTETEDAVKNALDASFSSVEIVNSEYVGASFAGNLGSQTIWLTIVALALILVYIWLRFSGLNFAISAILAIFHDVLFLLGFIGITQLDFTTATIAAILTIIGYSLNDTIVIFDRIRENIRIVKEESFQQVINISISQSLSRTIITSLTTLLAVLAIFIFGIGDIRTFALNLIVGVIVGTYSSIFIASSFLLSWHDRGVKKLKKKSSGAAAVQSEKAKAAKTVAPPPRQTAEEIAAATARKAEVKAKKKKKKK